MSARKKAQHVKLADSKYELWYVAKAFHVKFIADAKAHGFKSVQRMVNEKVKGVELTAFNNNWVYTEGVGAEPKGTPKQKPGDLASYGKAIAFIDPTVVLIEACQINNYHAYGHVHPTYTQWVDPGAVKYADGEFANKGKKEGAIANALAHDGRNEFLIADHIDAKYILYVYDGSTTALAKWPTEQELNGWIANARYSGYGDDYYPQQLQLPYHSGYEEVDISEQGQGQAGYSYLPPMDMGHNIMGDGYGYSQGVGQGMDTALLAVMSVAVVGLLCLVCLVIGFLCGFVGYKMGQKAVGSGSGRKWRAREQEQMV